MLRYAGLRRILYPAAFTATCAIFLSTHAAVAFEDRFGENLDKDRAYQSRSDVAYLDRSGPSGAMGRGDRGGATDSRGPGGGFDSHGGDGGGFPGPGGRNSGPDGNEGPGGGGGRGRGR
jgi:hypothetical protein